MNELILKEIQSKKNNIKAKLLSRFFKTGIGQYGEGDVFLGIMVPVSRKIAEKYKHISKKEIESLLKNKIHEVRLIALFILVSQYKKSDLKTKKEIANFYLKNTKYINNWDLVDLSAPNILGDFLSQLSPTPGVGETLSRLAYSKNIWEQRMAILATSAFIRQGDVSWTFKIAKMFLSHNHDLIHKATGWMLREAGKKDEKALREFLNANLAKMPRTMLRYSIEKFPENIRLKYLKK
jgi:3-methyladenine DNA glycosylase AlkD